MEKEMKSELDEALADYNFHKIAKRYFRMQNVRRRQTLCDAKKKITPR